MFTVKNALKRHQIETYLLIIFPILWILITGFFERSPFSILLGDYGDLLSLRLFLGGDMIKKGLACLYLYMYFRFFIWLGYLIRSKIFKEQIPPTIDVKRFLFSFVYFTVALGLTNLLLIIAIKQVSMIPSRTSIVAASEWCMNIDRYIFGVDPQVWIQQFSKIHFVDFLLIHSYRQLTLFFAITFTGLLLFNKIYFRKYLITIVLAPLLALPLWYILPAITPNEMYRHNIFALPSINATKQRYEEINLSDNLKNYLHTIEEKIEAPTQQYPLVTTNPSMHITWGIIITYFTILLWRPLGFVFIPWLVLNILGTIYTIQHYFIDFPPAIACAIIAIMLTNYLFKYEKKYYTKNHAPLYFVDILQADIEQLKTKCLSSLIGQKSIEKVY